MLMNVALLLDKGLVAVLLLLRAKKSEGNWESRCSVPPEPGVPLQTVSPRHVIRNTVLLIGTFRAFVTHIPMSFVP